MAGRSAVFLLPQRVLLHQFAAGAGSQQPGWHQGPGRASPAQYQGLPQVGISNYTAFNGQSGNYPKQNRIRSWQYVARSTYTSGKHEVRFGYENFHDTNTYFYGSNSVGTFSVGNNYSSDNFADLLLGYPSSGQRSYFRSTWGNFVNFQSMSVQDDYKSSSRLTINAGLRYEINPFYNGIKGQTSGFNAANGKVVIPSDFSMNAQPGTPTLYALSSDRIQFNTDLGLPTSIRAGCAQQRGATFWNCIYAGKEHGTTRRLRHLL